MINTVYPTFYKAPEALNVLVRNSNDVLPIGMIATNMTESVVFKRIVDRVFVGIDDGLALNVLSDQGHYRRTLDIGDRFDANLTFALCNTDHRDFMRTFSRSTLVVSTPFTTNVRFVDFNFVLEHTFVLIKKCANLLKHTPSCFISYASSALKFFSRKAGSGSCHLSHSIKPYLERRSSLVENRSSKRINLMSTKIAFITRPISYLMMLRNLLASWALNTIRKMIVLYPLKASIIIRENILPKSFVVNLICLIFHFFIPHLNIVYHKLYTLSRDSYQL